MFDVFRPNTRWPKPTLDAWVALRQNDGEAFFAALEAGADLGARNRGGVNFAMLMVRSLGRSDLERLARAGLAERTWEELMEAAKELSDAGSIAKTLEAARAHGRAIAEAAQIGQASAPAPSRKSAKL